MPRPRCAHDPVCGPHPRIGAGRFHGSPRGTASDLFLLLSAGEREEFAAVEIRKFRDQVRHLVHSSLGHVAALNAARLTQPLDSIVTAGQRPVKGEPTACRTTARSGGTAQFVHRLWRAVTDSRGHRAQGRRSDYPPGRQGLVDGVPSGLAVGHAVIVRPVSSGRDQDAPWLAASVTLESGASDGQGQEREGWLGMNEEDRPTRDNWCRDEG